MSNLTTVTFYTCQFQSKLTGGANFRQTLETYLYTWYKRPKLENLSHTICSPPTSSQSIFINSSSDRPTLANYNSWMRQNKYSKCFHPYSTLKITLKGNGHMQSFFIIFHFKIFIMTAAKISGYSKWNL